MSRLSVTARAVLWGTAAFASSVYAREGAGGTPYPGGEPLSVGGMLQIATGLLLVLGLIFGAAWLLRRFGRFQGMTTQQLRLIGGLNVGQREKILIVQVGEARLVVGVSPGGIHTLHVLAGPGADETPGGADPGPDQGGFLGHLRRAVDARERP